MRILHLNLEKGWRGGERQTLFTLQGLRDAGHQVALAARAGGPLAQRAQAAGIPVFPCAGSLALLRLLLAQRRSYEVIHAQTAQAMSLLAVLRPVLPAALVFTRRTAFDAPRRARRQRWKWRRADALVAISQAAAVAPRSLGLATVVIPSAVEPHQADPARVEALRRQFGLAGHRVLVTAAALSPEKDPLTLIEAVQRLRADHPDLVCLHCGADGAAADAARERVAALGLPDHYRFAGFQQQVGDCLALADVYVSSSRFEALGTSVLDACLAGLPVVATDVGGHREILDPDRGLLAQAHVAQVYSVPAMVAAYQQLYRRLLPA